MKAERLFKMVTAALAVLGASLFLTSCGLYSFYKNMRDDSEKWEELKDSIDDETAEKDISDNYHEARYQVKSRVIMSDIERGSSDHITELFSEKVRSDIGEEELEEQIADMTGMLKGELLCYETEQNGGSGHRGGKGVTTTTYTIVIYTDMDIYEMVLYYVETDLTSDDMEMNLANAGLHRIVAYPVSTAYDRDITAEGTLYSEYLDKEGVFYAGAEKSARETVYKGKGYTGYSVAYLQEYFYESAEKESCERLMEILDSVGFQGDITRISYDIPEDYAEAAEEGYDMLLEDEEGNIFFIKRPQWEEDQCIQALQVADAHLELLYEETEQADEG